MSADEAKKFGLIDKVIWYEWTGKYTRI
jgi:ATP-dependent protease ClpP protease subunit